MFDLWDTKNRCWKKSTKGLSATTNFLEVLVNDEEAILFELNHICGGTDMFFLGLESQKGDYL